MCAGRPYADQPYADGDASTTMQPMTETAQAREPRRVCGDSHARTVRHGRHTRCVPRRHVAVERRRLEKHCTRTHIHTDGIIAIRARKATHTSECVLAFHARTALHVRHTRCVPRRHVAVERRRLGKHCTRTHAHTDGIIAIRTHTKTHTRVRLCVPAIHTPTNRMPMAMRP